MKLKKLFSLLFVGAAAMTITACDKSSSSEYEMYSGVENQHILIKDIYNLRKLGAGLNTTQEEKEAAYNGSNTEASNEYLVYVYKADCYWCKEMKDDAFKLMKDYNYEDVYFLNTAELKKKSDEVTYDEDMEDDDEAAIYTKNVETLISWAKRGSTGYFDDSLEASGFGTPTVLRFARVNGYTRLVGAGIGGEQEGEKSKTSALGMIRSFSCLGYKVETGLYPKRATEETCNKLG